MHGSFEKYDEDKNNNLYRRWGIGFLLLPFLLVLALFVAAIVQPATSNWIGEAAQAEFSVHWWRAHVHPNAVRTAVPGNPHRQSLRREPESNDRFQR